MEHWWLSGKSEPETQRQATQHDCMPRLWAMGRWELIKCAEGNIIFCTEPVFKIKKCGKESTLFNRIHKHSFGGLGADTLTFLRVNSFFWGSGVLTAFSKAELGLPVFFVEPPLYDMRNLYLLNNVNLGLDSYSPRKNTRALLLKSASILLLNPTSPLFYFQESAGATPRWSEQAS